MTRHDPENLIQDFERTTWVIENQAKGVTHAESVLQLPFRGNCFNWVVGHILHSREVILTLLGGNPDWFPNEGLARYKRESDPLTQPDDGIRFEALLTAITDSGQQIGTRLQEQSVESLAVVIDEERQRTLGERIAWLHWHETYHTGQLELLRQLAGKDDAII